MNRWHVYSAMKGSWMDNQGTKSLTTSEVIQMFPHINDNELQEGIVEFRMMASRCYKEYGFDTDITECKA